MPTQTMIVPLGDTGASGSNGSSGVITGNDGQVGGDGQQAPGYNGMTLAIDDCERFSILGGNGGDGGPGGNGGSGSFWGRGGSGGDAGNGGDGTSFSLIIGKQATVTCTAGAGGVGKDGGDGGKHGFLRPGCCGDGGNGGKGGKGGWIKFSAGAGSNLVLTAGNGGAGGDGRSGETGGNGGDGGKGGDVEGTLFAEDPEEEARRFLGEGEELERELEGIRTRSRDSGCASSGQLKTKAGDGGRGGNVGTHRGSSPRHREAGDGGDGGDCDLPGSDIPGVLGAGDIAPDANAGSGGNPGDGDAGTSGSDGNLLGAVTP